MPLKLWLKTKGPPDTTAPELASCKAAGLELIIVKADKHVFALHAPVWGERHSTPPPTVHVVTVSLPEVEMSQLPHPVAVH